MLELDQFWSKLLADATTGASQAGRADIVEYLMLRSSRDKIRSAGVDWLLTAMLENAYAPEHLHRRFRIEREEPHNFAHGNSNMVGVRLDIQYGVRCLSVEAGWARTPADGIMRGGALVAGRISHFGLPKLTVDLRLVQADDLPRWIDDEGSDVTVNSMSRHIELLVGE